MIAICIVAEAGTSEAGLLDHVVPVSLKRDSAGGMPASHPPGASTQSYARGAVGPLARGGSLR
jgi:hypothetical protein